MYTVVLPYLGAEAAARELRVSSSCADQRDVSDPDSNPADLRPLPGGSGRTPPGEPPVTRSAARADHAAASLPPPESWSASAATTAPR